MSSTPNPRVIVESIAQASCPYPGAMEQRVQSQAHHWAAPPTPPPDLSTPQPWAPCTTCSSNFLLRLLPSLNIENWNFGF